MLVGADDKKPVSVGRGETNREKSEYLCLPVFANQLFLTPSGHPSNSCSARPARSSGSRSISPCLQHEKDHMVTPSSTCSARTLEEEIVGQDELHGRACNKHQCSAVDGWIISIFRPLRFGLAETTEWHSLKHPRNRQYFGRQGVHAAANESQPGKVTIYVEKRYVASSPAGAPRTSP